MLNGQKIVRVGLRISVVTFLTFSSVHIVWRFPPTIERSTVEASYSTDSLVGYWKFDEGTGTTAADSSGHGNKGTLTNGPTWTTTKPSLNFTNPYALSFDGSNDYVITTSNMGLSGDFEATISAWVKFNDTNTGYKAIVDFGSTGVREGFALFQGINGAGSITVGFYGAQNCNTSASTITTGQWYHLVGTKVPGAIGVATTKLNINGSQQSISCNTSSVPNMVNGKLYIGSDAASEISNSILVDDVRIYSRALSTAEISELAAGSHTTTIWTGGTSTNWETASNWSPAAVPDPYSNIIIRTGTYQPVMTAHNSGSSLTIETSATLDLKNHNFELTDGGSIKGGGTLKLIGAQTMENVSNTSTGTVLYYGSGSVSSLAAGSTYYNLTIEDPTESGLVGYWKFDEGTGTSAADSSGNGNTGTLTNGPTWTTTKPTLQFNNPYALSLDGTDDYVDLGSSTSLKPTTALTVAAWIKTSGSLTSYKSVFISPETSGDAGGYGMFGISTNKIAFYLDTNGSSGWAHADTTTALTQGVWYQISQTWDGANLKIYVNSVLEATTAAGSIGYGTTAKNAEIGRYRSYGNFPGQIDDVRIYNRALSASEVSSLSRGEYADPDNGTATITLGSALDINGNLNIVSGILDASASNYNINLAGNWYAGTGSFVKRSGTVTLDGTAQTLSGTTLFHNLTKSVTSPTTLFIAHNAKLSVSGSLTLRGISSNVLSIRSTRAGSGARLFLDGDAGTQTIDYLNVKDANATGGQALECLTSSEGCTNSGNNSNWTFSQSYSISGRAYSDEGITALASKTVGVSINGATMANSTTTNAAGAYTISGVSTSKGDVLTLWVDGHSEKAVTVTISSGSTMTGVSLYKNYLIVRNETGGTITNSHLATAKTSNSSDTDISAILSQASATGATTVGGKTLLLAAGTTFAPGGTLSLGGSFKANGTFSPGTSTVTITATGASTITTNGSSLYSLTVEDTTESGLVGYWKFDEGTGTSTADSSGNGNTGTLTNGPTWTTTKPNLGFNNPYALSLDGVNDYVATANNLNVGGSALTVCAWVRSNGASGIQSAVRQQANGGGNYIVLAWATTQNILSNDGGTSGLSSGVTHNDTWQHLCMAWQQNTTNGFKSYKDGAIVAQRTSTNTAIANIGAPFEFGRYAGNSEFFKGYLDDVRIYSRALSDSEVSSLSRGEYADPDNGTATITLGSALDINGNLNIVSGILDASASNYNINLAGNFYAGTGSFVKRSGTVTLDGTTQTLSGTTVFHNLTKSVTSPTTLFIAHNAKLSVSGSLTLQGISSNLLSLRSTRAGSGARLFLDGDAGTQTIDYLNVKDANATGGQALECLTSSEGCTNSGNNTNWSFAPMYSISGRAYSDEGITALASKTVGVSINGATMANSTTTNAAGAFTISSLSTSKGDVLSLWLDGHTEKAVTVTVSSGSTMTGVSLFQNYLILRNETGGTITNSHLATAKTSNSSDTDISAILSAASASAITTVGGKTLLIAANTTFAHDGTLTLGGSLKAIGTFNPGASTLTITATGASTITMNGSSLYNLTIEDPTESGLVGYWKFDEGTGTSAADSSGNGKTGTLTNGPTWTTTKPSLKFNNPYALSFDGADDYVSIPSTLNNSLNSSTISVSVWANPNALTTYYALISEAYAGDGVVRFTLTPWNTGKIAAAFFDGGWRIAEATVATSQWSHLTGTYNGSTLKFYVNGSEAASLSYAGSLSGSESWYVGRRWDLANYFSGYLDDVRIYNRLLTATEILSLAQGFYADPDNGTATITLGSALDVNGSLNIVSGILDASASNYNINLAGNWSVGTGSFVKRSGTVTLDGTTQTISGTTLFHNLTKSVTSPTTLFIAHNAKLSVSGSLTLQGISSNLLSLRSTRAGSGARLFLDGDAGTQTIDYLNVKDANATGGQALECLTSSEGCTNSGNNTNWSFSASYSISGTAYSDEGTTPLASKTIAVSVNGAVTAGTDTTDAGGYYSITGISTSAGDVLTLWVDGETQKAVTVTVSSGSTMTGVSLYQNYLIVRNETGGTITNTHLATAKTSNSSDTDISAILSQASASAMTTVGGKTLLIGAGSTFAPGGTLSLGGSFKALGTLTTSSRVTINGTATLDMGSNTLQDLTIGTNVATATLQPGSEGIDTYIYQSAPTTSYGSATFIYLANEPGFDPYRIRGLFAFDLSDIPAGATIQSATLQVYNYNCQDSSSGCSPTHKIGLYQLDREITESATWNTYNGTNAWTTGGGDYSTLFDEETLAGTGVGSGNGWVTFGTGSTSFGEYLDSVHNGGTDQANLLMRFTQINYWVGREYYSSDYTTASLRPKLVVTYGDTSSTVTLNSNLNIDGNLVIENGAHLDPSASNYNINLAGNWYAGTGSFVKRSGTVTLDGTTQTLSGTTLFHNLTKSVTSPTTLFVAHNAQLSVSGSLTLQGISSNLLSLRSTRAGSGARLFLDGDSGTQTISYLDVKDSNATGGATLECLTASEGCVNSGNNTKWAFTPVSSISGTAYSDEGTTPLASKTIAVSVNGSATAGTDATDAGGYYSITGLSTSKGDILTLWVDGHTEKAVTVTVSSGSTMTGVSLYKNYLILRNETGGTITNTHLATAKTSNSSDTDISAILSAASASAMTTVGGKTLLIGAGSTFAPGGTLSLGGSFKANGTFSPGTSTVTITATGASTITTNGSSLYNLTIEDPTESGLVGYWKFDEGTGTSAADSSGNGKAGTLTNGPTWTTTKPSLQFNNPYALSFDGGNDYIAASPSIGTTATFSVWASYTSLPSGYGMLFALQAGSPGPDLFFYNGKISWNSYNGDSNSFGTIPANANNGSYHHYVVVVESGNTKLYYDGSLYGTATYYSPATSVLQIGGQSAYFWAGNIDDFRIYNRALSAAEITSLAQGYYADSDNGTATITLGSSLDVNGSLQVVSGILDVSASNFAINVAKNWYAGGGSFVKRSGTVTLDGTSQTMSGTTVFHNLTKSVTSTDTLTIGYSTQLSISGALTLQGAASNLLSIRSTLGGTNSRIILDGDSGTQTIAYLDVKDNDATGGVALECYTATEGCVNSGNNTNWTFAVASFGDISGKVYSDEGTTPLQSKTISLSINGAADAATSVTTSNGSYSFTGISLAQGDVLTLYIEDATEDAVTVTLAGSGAMTNVDLYQNHLITRSENGGALSNANLATADNTGDTDITGIYTMSSQALTMVSGKELFIPTGHTYQPSAAVTTALLDIRGTYVHGSETLTMNGSYTHSTGTFTGGSGIVDINGAFTISGGTFTTPSGTMYVSGNFTKTGSPTWNATSGTVYFDSTTTTTVDAPSIVFNRVVIYRSAWCNGGSFTVAANTTLPFGTSPTLTFEDGCSGTSFVNNGTLTVGTGTLTINVTTTFTNNGTITATNMNGIVVTPSFVNNGTLTMPSATTIDFNNSLTNGSSGVITTTAGPVISVAGSLTIPSTSTFPSNATMIFDSRPTVTIDAPSIIFTKAIINSNLWCNGGTFTVSAGTELPLGSSPTISYTDGCSGRYFVNNGTLTVGTGTLTINVTTTFTNNGSIITRSAVRSGTAITNGTNSNIEFIGATDGQAAIQTITGFATSYYHLYIGSADAGDMFALGSSPTVTGNVTVSGGTLDLAGYNLSPSGQLRVGTGTTLRLHGDETVSNFAILNKNATVYYDDTTGTIPMLNKEFWHLVIGSAGSAVYTFPNPYRESLTGSLTISGGTLAVTNGQLLTVSGSWIQSGTGRFSAGSGSVTLNGGNQSIAGTTVFNNLTKTVSLARTLTFAASGQTSVSGSLVLRGSELNLLSIRSATPSTASRLILDADSGSQTLDYLNVKDNDATGGLQLECLATTEGCIDSGNTTNWSFGAVEDKGFFYFFGF